VATSKITRFLEMLGDGRWHLLEEIQRKSKIDKNQIRKIVRFLREYDFIIVDEKSQRIKLEETVQRFLAQTTTS
jgi:DNA-binding IclR family transcriptional regulator